MKKFLQKLWKVAAVVGCVVIATGLVLAFPPIAIGFMAVPAVAMVKDPYAKVLVGAAASILAAILILNIAELAILATAFPVAEALQNWGMSIRAAA